MTVTIYELRTSAMKRVAARLSRKVTVELGTGRTVEIEKGKHMSSTGWEGEQLSKSEEFDCSLAENLVGA